MKTKLTHRIWAKACAYILLTISAASLLLSALGIVMAWSMDMYTRPKEQFKTIALENIALTNALSGTSASPYHLLWDEADANRYAYAQYYAETSNLEYRYLDGNGEEIWSSAAYQDIADTPYLYLIAYGSYKDADGHVQDHARFYHSFHYERINMEESISRYAQEYADVGFLLIAVDPSFPIQDDLSLLNRLLDMFYEFRFAMYILSLISLLLMVICFVFLMCAAGHRADREELAAGWVSRVPFDLYSAAVALTGFLGAGFAWELSYRSDFFAYFLMGALIVAAVPFVTWWCAQFALRCKLGQWWRNTLVFRTLRLLWRMVKLSCRAARRFFRGLGSLAAAIPLMWKSALAIAALLMAEFLVILFTYHEPDTLLILWVLEKLFLVPAALYLLLMLRSLQEAGRALAEGDLAYQVDTGRMLWDFREHGENLNSLAHGMTRAVDERMKSERFKTELITNVSHDIKTPLTSIINYSDLISREDCGNETAQEYARVLHRQSERLKKLLEDLMDASKASTGNLEVLPVPCEAGVLLSQTAGEYEQRLRDAGLELIVKQPAGSLRIMADGRHISRVMDNLMNNICKYAQSGTRVYLSLEAAGDQAVFTFKNTSRYALDISSEELMERFVRGDSSRSTEGSGLGLSIAKSLTERQGGRLELFVDGDLFKAILSFKQIP